MTELEKRIDNIRHALVKMASIVETNINNSIKCLTERNKSLSDEIFTQELEVDKLDNEIDTQGIETLALFQPVSEDLRYVVMAMKINKDLERIGYHAEVITRKAVELINGKFETESSGGINESTIAGYAECGVDFVSLGAITHSINNFDLSLKAC